MSKQLANKVRAIERRERSKPFIHRLPASELHLLLSVADIVQAAGIAAMKLETRGGRNVADSDGAYNVLMRALMPALEELDAEGKKCNG